jgi:hypothetical protein
VWRTTLAALTAVVAMAVPAAGTTQTGVTGHLWDTTCPGPCSPGLTDPRPYTGSNFKVAVRSLPDRQLVDIVDAPKGHYTALLEPGRYRLTPRAHDPCLSGDPRRVTVEVGELRHRRLFVHNDCIV